MELSSFWLNLLPFFRVLGVFLDFSSDFSDQKFDSLFINLPLSFQYDEEEKVKDIVFFLRFKVVMVDEPLLVFSADMFG